MTRYKLTVSYDGTEYAGWQIQPRHVTVQEKIQAAILTVTGERAVVHGSGRTDQGVHARGQVAHIDLEKDWSPREICRALNAVLPPDIRIGRASRAAPDFHARRSVREKEYRYFIWNADSVPPFLRLYRTQIRQPLDIGVMREACGYLRGRHDFAAFTANPNRLVASAVRTLSGLSVTKRGAEIVIAARSEGFLYRMVRSLAGLLIRVGEGAVPPLQAKVILASRERTARVPTAPPQGLFLWKVEYGASQQRAGNVRATGREREATDDPASFLRNFRLRPPDFGATRRRDKRMTDDGGRKAEGERIVRPRRIRSWRKD